MTEGDNATVYRFGRVEKQLLAADSALTAFSAPQFAEQVMEEVAADGVVEPRLLSFDVFDTILLRNNKSELRRFWEIAGELSEPLGVDRRDLLVARLTSTRSSYRTSPAVAGYREGELEDIHRLTLHLLGDGRDDLVELMVATELDYEIGNLTLNPAISALRLLAPDARVVAASNMYMSSGHIMKLLRAHAAPVELVYSSTETKKSKNDTRLLRQVQLDFGEEAGHIVHFGDSFKSDFVPAKRLGWAAQWWPIPLKSRLARKSDALACLAELEDAGVPLGSLAAHFVENP